MIRPKAPAISGDKIMLELIGFMNTAPQMNKVKLSHESYSRIQRESTFLPFLTFISGKKFG
jgi:hypothetical protein